MVRSEALKKAQQRYRQKADKYEKIKAINAKSNRKRYNEDEELRQKKLAKMREYNQTRKILKQEDDEEEEVEETLANLPPMRDE
jgi:hypothetical protein